MSQIGNQLKTTILLGTLFGLLLMIGSFVGGFNGIILFGIIGLIINIITFYKSDKIVLKIYKAIPVEKTKYNHIKEIIKNIAKKAKIPMPKVYLIPTNNLNAFATGRNPKNAAIAFTQGIAEHLNKKELEGVLAHELTHIKNKDTLITTVAVMISGLISTIAFAARWAAIFGGGRDDNGGILEIIVIGILAPLIATILHLAISRSREYIADAGSAKLLKDGNPLANALAKIENNNPKHPLRFGSPNSASLFIANPFKRVKFASLFNTHPPTKERIKKLKEFKL